MGIVNAALGSGSTGVVNPTPSNSIFPSSKELNEQYGFSDKNSFKGWLNKTFDNDAYQRYLDTLDREYASSEAIKDRDFQKQQADLAYERQKEFMQNSYQWTIEDMKKAGLNPLLAISQGSNTAPSIAMGNGSRAQSHKSQSQGLGQIYNMLYDGAKNIIKGISEQKAGKLKMGISLLSGII